MGQTWKVFSDFHQTDNLKHDEDCSPLYRNLYVVIQSIPKKTLYFLYLYTETDVVVEAAIIFLCVCTHMGVHTHTHPKSTPDVMPKFLHFFTVVCGIISMVTVNQYTVTF